MRSTVRALAAALLFLSVVPQIDAANYYADAINGSDVTGDGSVGRPFRTLTRTLASAVVSGDSAVAQPGIYDPSIGESFPLRPAAGVSLFAFGGAQVTILDAAETAFAVIDLVDGNTVRGFTITGSPQMWWTAGLHFNDHASNIVIDSCVLTGNERGIWGDGGTGITITSCVFTQNTNDAISIFESTDVKVLNNSFDANLKGVLLDGSTGVVHGNVITRSVLSGIECGGGSIDADYNCLFDNTNDYSSSCGPGAHDVFADPIFVNAGKGDLHVSAVSPVLDKSDSGLPGQPERDLDFQTFGNGAGRDIGADEIYPRFLYIAGFTALGRDVAVSLIAKPFDVWVLFVSLTTGHVDTDHGTFLLGFPVVALASGVAPNNGIVSLAGTFPDNPTFVGLRLYFQAVSGDELSNLATMTVY
jgi:hypothetical protein